MLFLQWDKILLNKNIDVDFIVFLHIYLSSLIDLISDVLFRTICKICYLSYRATIFWFHREPMKNHNWFSARVSSLLIFLSQMYARAVSNCL
jgi:hypothetical protein